MKAFKNYPGGKDGNGTLQNIVNLVPEHDCYFELFLGNGALFRGMKKSKTSVLNDIDPDVYSAWEQIKNEYEPFCLYNEDAIKCIQKKRLHPFSLDYSVNFIFLDLPYRFKARKSQKQLYSFELNDDDHINCLEAIKSYQYAKIMICHYPDPMYDEILTGWHTHDYRSMTRAGMADERLYMNYPKPERLHDYSYIGDNFTNRQQLKRMRINMIKKLSKLDPVLRNSMLLDITQHFLTMSDQSDI